MIVGASNFSLRRETGKTIGNAVIASETGKIFFGMSFQAAEYPFEKIAFDSQKVQVAFTNPGTRSALGNFIMSHRNIFSEGLIGSSLSANWSLLNLQSRKAESEFAGKKKTNGRDVYVLDYLPKGGSDLSIKLFFDSETFQHIRTEYKQTFSAAQGNKPEDSSRQQESHQILTEDFSDFKAEGGLTLPHSYHLNLALDSRKGLTEYEWSIDFSQFFFNQKLAANSFNIEGK